MKRLLVFATLALIAAACSSTPNVTTVDSSRGNLPIKPNPNINPNKNTFDVTGLLEVTVTGIDGDAKNAKATAVFHNLNNTGKLGTKAIFVSGGTVTLTQKFVSSFDLTNAGITKRYVQTGFDILNPSTTVYFNMTMVATSLLAATTDSGVVTTIGGTAISNMVNNTGATITDVNVARNLVPTHGFTPGFSFAPNPNLADMQYLTPAEAATVKAMGQSSGRISAINVNKILPLEYGFSGRNVNGTSRIIASPSSATYCPAALAATCNKGFVTFAQSFTLNTNAALNPTSYKTWYIVANETVKTYSKALEGDAVNGAPTVAGLLFTNPEIVNNRTRVLENGSAGKSIAPSSGADLLENLCQVQTANAVGATPALKYPSSLQTAVGSLRGCFGEAGKRLKAPPVAEAQFGVRSARVAATVDGGKVVFSQRRQFNVPDPCASNNDEAISFDYFRPDGNVYGSFRTVPLGCRLIDAEGDSTAANVPYLLSRDVAGGYFVDQFSSAGTIPYSIQLPSGVDWKRIVMHNAAIGSNTKPLYVLGQVGTTGFGVLRLNGTNLTVDTTFGTAGTLSLDFPTETVNVIDMAVSSAGLYILNQRNSSTFVLKLLHTGAVDTNYGSGGYADLFAANTQSPLFPNSIAVDSSNLVFIAGSTCLSLPTCTVTTANLLFAAKFDVDGSNYGGPDNAYGYAEYPSCGNPNGSVQITTRASNGDALLFANGAANTLPGSGADFCVININGTGLFSGNAEISRRTFDMNLQNDQFLDLDTSANVPGTVSIAGLSTSSVNRYFVADVNR